MGETKQAGTGGFLKQGSILAMASILVRMIGLVYRIPMNNILGDEGMGIYSASYEVYNIMLIISSYGLPMAVSKMVSAKCAERRYRSAYNLFYRSLVFSLFTGGAAALFLYFGADFLEENFFAKYHGIALPLRVLAPTIFIVAVMGVFRGLFQGRKTMMPTAVSQIFEQIINAFVSVAASFMLMRRYSQSPDVAGWGAAGGTMGTLFGAIAAFIILFFIYLLYRPVMEKQKRRDRISARESLSASYKLILWTVVPIILSQTVYQLSGIIDVTLFNMAMESRGMAAREVSSLLGIYSTKYRLLVNVPAAVSTAIASSMIPALVSSYLMGNKREVHERAGLAVKFNMIIAFPSAVGLAVLGEPILRLLFRNSDFALGGAMLMTGSACVIFYALSTVTSGVLQSIDKMNLPVIHSLISLVLHVVLVYGLLMFTEMGVFALVLGNVTYPMLVCYLNGRSVRKYTGFRQEVVRTFSVPLIASVLMGIVTYLVYQGCFMATRRIIVAVIPAVFVAVFSYFVLVLKLQSLNRAELYEFPFGRRMSILADKLHLLRD